MVVEENARSLYMAAGKFNNINIGNPKENAFVFCGPFVRNGKFFNLRVWEHLNVADKIREATFIYSTVPNMRNKS